MRFLVDECVGAAMVALLRDEGHDVFAVADVMPEAVDEDILAYAVRKDRIVVTNDKDFGELVYRSGWAHRGILLLRLRDERTENKVRVMRVVLAQIGERLCHHYTVVTETGIRVRK